MKSETFFDQTGYRSGRDRQSRGGYRLCAVLGVVQADVFDLDDGHAPERPRVRRIKAPDRQHPAYAALMRSSTVLDVVADLIGPNIRFDHAKLNCKPAGGGAIEWHQDWAFYPQTNDDMLAVSVMLDDCEADNGPRHVIPRWRLNVQTSPRVHRAFSNLETRLKATRHGVSSKHLPQYENEFVFLFNRRRTPRAAFQSLLGLTTHHAPHDYTGVGVAPGTAVIDVSEQDSGMLECALHRSHMYA